MGSFEFQKPVFPGSVSRSKAEYTAGFLSTWAGKAGLTKTTEETDRPFSATAGESDGAWNVHIQGPWGDGQAYRDDLGARIAEWAAADVSPTTKPNPELYRHAPGIAAASLMETVQAPDII